MPVTVTGIFCFGYLSAYDASTEGRLFSTILAIFFVIMVGTVFSTIFGTMLLVFLMCIIVMPLGVNAMFMGYIEIKLSFYDVLDGVY